MITKKEIEGIKPLLEKDCPTTREGEMSDLLKRAFETIEHMAEALEYYNDPDIYKDECVLSTGIVYSDHWAKKAKDIMEEYNSAEERCKKCQSPHFAIIPSDLHRICCRCHNRWEPGRLGAG